MAIVEFQTLIVIHRNSIINFGVSFGIRIRGQTFVEKFSVVLDAETSIIFSNNTDGVSSLTKIQTKFAWSF